MNVTSSRRVAAVALPTRLSPSSLECFRQCPQLFQYRYIEKLPEPTTTALARGISIHDSLQNLYDLDPSQRTEPVLHDLFRASWTKLRKKEKYASLFLVGGREAEREWGLESLNILSDYLLLESPAATHPLLREERFSASVDPASGDDTYPGTSTN
jgi:putative RecB family exonuclease